MIRYLTAGESHGKALVGIIEGVPSGLSISEEYINQKLSRRQKGFGRGGRMRIETDQVKILSGVRFGKTLGSPISLMIENRDWENWKDKMSISDLKKEIEKINIPRPGHADLSGMIKYKFDDIRNVIERASARETAMRVALCSISQKFLEEFKIEIGSFVVSIGKVEDENSEKNRDKILQNSNASKISAKADLNELRMLSIDESKNAISLIKQEMKSGDTLGGIFEVVVSGLPIGLGSYVQWDRKLDAKLGEAILSIQAVKGVEVGEAFENAKKFGSEVHDELFFEGKKNILRKTNRAGGVEGGMTNGNAIIIRAAMKPISTLAKGLSSIDLEKNKNVQSRYERSDVCAVPACSVIAESVVAPVIANSFLEKFGGDSISEINQRYKNL
ncbi:MAG: chorismate synthase [Bacteroidota bacterium]